MAFSDMVRITFSDPAFAESMVPIMHDMMSPLIQDTIKAAVNTATTNLAKLVTCKYVSFFFFSFWQLSRVFVYN